VAGASAALVIGCDDKIPAPAIRLALKRPSVAVEIDDLALPRRPPRAPTGSEFIARTRRMSRPEREKAVIEEILGGNVPSFLRTLVEVPVTHRDGKVVHTGFVRVTPDYLSIGTDDDFIRMPMNGRSAQRIAQAASCVLPTPALVDAIYRTASLKLSSSPLPPGEEMMSSEYFERHNAEIEEHRRRAQGRLGALTAGHKKDVVITRRLEYEPHQLAIYGWHRDDGVPLQLLSTFHEDTYVDYTHGVRLVAGQMALDGEIAAVGEVLRDARRCALLSGEGPVSASYAI
jgi:hypothetical protein